MAARLVQLLAGGAFGMALAATIPFLVEQGTEPKGHIVMWLLYGAIAVSAILWSLATYARRRSGRAAPSVVPEAHATLSDRAALARYLADRIVEVAALQRAVAEEAAKPVPDVLRLDGIQAAFWQLNTEVARRLQVAAPEWARYWDENPPWFSSSVTRITSEQFAMLARFYGWVADRMLHIKARLP